MIATGKDYLVRGSGIHIEKFISRQLSSSSIQVESKKLKLNGKVTITMVSRMIKTKGVLEYIQAAEIVKSDFKDVAFLLVGPIASKGSQAIPLELLKSKSKVVNYLGPRNDIPEILSMTDVFVLPSYYGEGLPRVLLEAGAIGMPLITTTKPGCRDVVKDGWNGLLVPPKDAVKLAQAITQLINSKDMRIKMGKRSKKFVSQHFHLDHVADEYARIYKTILG